MNRNLGTNTSRKAAWMFVHRRSVRARNVLRPQDYRRDEQVVVYETCPREAIRRLERFKAERAAGLR